MTNQNLVVKKCGVLRGVCGMLISNTPQNNQKGDNGLYGLRYVAGCCLYPLYTRARARAHVRSNSKQTPQLPADWFNPVKDSDLRCGVYPSEYPAKTPQETPQISRRAS